MSEAAVLRLLRDEGLILPAHYQRERRKLAERRRAAFANAPAGPNQVWQLDFSEFETTGGGTWRLAGCRDYWSKYEHPFHVSPTGNQHDVIDAIELALADYEAMFGHPMASDCPVDPDTGELLPVVTVVTDNGGSFRSFRFEAFIELHPELAHVRTRGEVSWAERIMRTRVRHPEIRAALHRRSTTPSCSPSGPRSTGSNTTRPGRTGPSRRTGPRRCTWAWPTPPYQHFKRPKTCQLLDAAFHRPIDCSLTCSRRSCLPLRRRAPTLAQQKLGVPGRLVDEVGEVVSDGLVHPGAQCRRRSSRGLLRRCQAGPKASAAMVAPLAASRPRSIRSASTGSAEPSRPVGHHRGSYRTMKVLLALVDIRI